MKKYKFTRFGINCAVIGICLSILTGDYRFLALYLGYCTGFTVIIYLAEKRVNKDDKRRF